MTQNEVIGKIKKICGSCAVENDCPFFNEEYNECIFAVEGLEIPLAWRADNADK